MTLPIVLSPQAEKDFVDIWRYSNSAWGEIQADAYLREINSGVQLLSEHPLMGIDYADIREGYRKFQVEKHNIFYLPSEHELLVIRVLHTSVDVENWLD